MRAAAAARKAAMKSMELSKRPAAAGKAAMKSMKLSKRPAAAIHVAKAAPGKKSKGKKPVPGWSVARRIKEYPKGCSKCAYKSPGCTPSCFKARGQI